MRKIVWSAGLALIGACQTYQPVVRVVLPNIDGSETPGRYMVITYYPYDVDSVRTAVETKSNAGPRPYTRELDSLFAAFRPYFVRYVRLVDLGRTLVAREPRSAAAEDSLAKITVEIARAQEEMRQAQDKYWPAIDEYRAKIREWSKTAYRDYSSEARALMGRRLAAYPTNDTTDDDGVARPRLMPGRWWVVARAFDQEDPNREWYWNVPLRGDTTVLDPRTGQHRPRY